MSADCFSVCLGACVPLSSMELVLFHADSMVCFFHFRLFLHCHVLEVPWTLHPSVKPIKKEVRLCEHAHNGK